MNKNLGLSVVLVFLVLFSVQLQAQTTRVLIVGDSWAEQQWTDQVHEMVFDVNGFGDITVNGSTTAISGSEAADWVVPSQLQLIADALSNNSDIDTVQITIGGNDFLGAWDATMSEPDQLQLQQQISTDIQTIIDFVLLQSADIEVILSFYDYPNFVDTLTGLSGIFCNPLYNDMAQPSPAELNSAATSFEAVYAQLALNNPRVFYVSHLGLMQFSYGFPDDGIQPGDLTLPGDLSLPSPEEAMRVTIGILDCFHLRPAGYDLLVQNLFDGYYHERFDTLFKSGFEQ